MDRALYVAMAGAKEIMQAQTVNANNLANVSTNGFKADLNAFMSVPVNGPGYQSRVYAVDGGNGVDLSPGAIQATGRDLDVAVQGDGYIAVQAADGSEAYTRAGNLKLDAGGQLLTGAGHPVLGSGGPMAVPPSEKLEIGADGTISVRPLGQSAATLSAVDRIKLVKIPVDQLRKGDDGLLRVAPGNEPTTDGSVRVVSGALEGSNVNAVDSMVTMISLSRSYEMTVKAMRSVEDNDRAASELIKLS